MWKPIAIAPTDGTLILACAKNGTGKWMQPAVMRFVGKLHCEWEIACLPGESTVGSDPVIWTAIEPLPDCTSC
jgi:hypothetical protein